MRDFLIGFSVIGVVVLGYCQWKKKKAGCGCGKCGKSTSTATPSSTSAPVSTTIAATSNPQPGAMYANGFKYKNYTGGLDFGSRQYKKEGF